MENQSHAILTCGFQYINSSNATYLYKNDLSVYVSCFSTTVAGFVALFFGLIGFILNFLIIATFCKRKPIRKKLPNILLMHQAIVDIFNSAAYVIPYACFKLFLSFEKDVNILVAWSERFFYIQMIFIVPVSYSSSLNTFTVIALERYLAICKPFFHRKHITKKKCIYTFVIFWILAPSMLIVMITVKAFRKYVNVATLINLFFMILCTILYVWTYSRARNSVRGNLKYQYTQSTSTPENQNVKTEENKLPSNKISSTNIQTYRAAKSELRLTLIFAVMYIVFLITLVPAVSVLFYDNDKMVQYEYYILHIPLAVSSFINAILTMTLKKDFKIKNCIPCKRI